MRCPGIHETVFRLKRSSKDYRESNVATGPPTAAPIRAHADKTSGAIKSHNSIRAASAIAARSGQTAGRVVRTTDSAAGHGPEPESERKVR